MKLTNHPVPRSEQMFSGEVMQAGISSMAKAYRAELDKHYARDTEEVRQQVEEKAKNVR